MPRMSARHPLIPVSRRLARRVDSLRFDRPITHVYNPLDYARAPHEEYLRRYARVGCDAVLVGMNPGPWGMAQTGVPFGAIGPVRDWLGICASVRQPSVLHPRRPIEGFDCAREEVSGQRLWGWAADRFGTAERFAERFFIWNYCPLVFYDAAGRNLTPDKLRAADRGELFAACDDALRSVVSALESRLVIGVGSFAEERAREALAGARVGRVLHPSPASPVANRGWAEQAEKQLVALGVDLS